MLTEEHVGWEKVLQGWKWFTDDKSSEPFWDITNASSRSCLKALVLLLLIWMRKVKWSAVCPQRIFSFKIKKSIFSPYFFFSFFSLLVEKRGRRIPLQPMERTHTGAGFSQRICGPWREEQGESVRKGAAERSCGGLVIAHIPQTILGYCNTLNCSL